MRTVFGSWKYIFKNLWFVLPFSVVPAVFMALSLDYDRIAVVVRGFFTGTPQAGFLDFFHAWSFFRFDSVLGVIYSAVAVVSIIFFMSALMAFVEKHMRLGKRTLSGVGTQFLNALPSAAFVTIAYLIFYEIWAVVLSAVLYVISQADIVAVVYVMYIAAVLIFLFVLVYLATVLYLWLPCKLMTGFRFFEAFLYSYRLMVERRWKLVLSFAISAAVMLAVIGGCVSLPDPVFRIIGAALFLLIFPNFCVRMDVVYIEGDKLEREDELHSYRRY